MNDETSWLSSDPENNDTEFVFVAVWEKVDTPVEEPFFVDVKKSDWFYNAVKYVYDQGLMSGLTTTHFGPNVALTREQFATILYRMNGSPAVDATSSTFYDVADGIWYTKAVIWATENKIHTLFQSCEAHFMRNAWKVYVFEKIQRKKLALEIWKCYITNVV